MARPAAVVRGGRRKRRRAKGGSGGGAGLQREGAAVVPAHGGPACKGKVGAAVEPARGGRRQQQRRHVTKAAAACEGRAQRWRQCTMGGAAMGPAQGGRWGGQRTKGGGKHGQWCADMWREGVAARQHSERVLYFSINSITIKKNKKSKLPPQLMWQYELPLHFKDHTFFTLRLQSGFGPYVTYM